MLEKPPFCLFRGEHREKVFCKQASPPSSQPYQPVQGRWILERGKEQDEEEERGRSDQNMRREQVNFTQCGSITRTNPGKKAGGT